MESRALEKWNKERAKSLDEIEQAHEAVGGASRERRFATQQINQAYVVLLSSQFQGFCRDLHTECIEWLVDTVQPEKLKSLLRTELELHRKLDKGNANPTTLGADFNRFEIKFWTEIQDFRKNNTRRQAHLETLNEWRNAIAHQNFTPLRLGNSPQIKIAEVRKWRKACNGLANSFDSVMNKHLQLMTGSAPW